MLHCEADTLPRPTLARKHPDEAKPDGCCDDLSDYGSPASGIMI
ncbi:hypothetical protein [Sphingomonas radiodurans]|nr:hypothetical protein [Sphingomonas radiodurans]WBH15759.1 hypothetical protein LLW23_13165 [Sphingomonas radiodurans]